MFVVVGRMEFKVLEILGDYYYLSSCNWGLEKLIFGEGISCRVVRS